MFDTFSLVLGAVMGAAIGDALGLPVRTMTYAQIVEKYGENGICRYDIDRWANVAQVSDALRGMLYAIYELLPEETSPLTGGLKLERVDSGDGLFPAMRPKPYILRTVPVALWNRKHPAKAADAAARAMEQAGGGLEFQMSAAVLAGMLAQAVQGVDLYDAMPVCVQHLKVHFGDHQSEAIRQMADALDMAAALSYNRASDISNIRILSGTCAGHRDLILAMYAALRYQDDFSDAIIAAVNHSGDSCATGAIAGCIVGARLGLHEIERNDYRWFCGLQLLPVIYRLAQNLVDEET